MTELSFAILRYIFVAFLWIFVFLAYRTVIRNANLSSVGQSKVPAFNNITSSEPAIPVSHGEPQFLILEGGPNNGQKISLASGEITFGRSDKALVKLDDQYVSLVHLRIFKQGQNWFAEDLDSTNGSFIDNSPLIGISQFKWDNIISIGATNIRLGS